MRTALLLVALLLLGLLALRAAGRVRSRRGFATSAERVTFETLHTANLAAPPLRLGLTATSAGKSARHLRTLLGTPAVALTDTERPLVWEGPGDHHAPQLHAAGAAPLAPPPNARIVEWLSYGRVMPDCAAGSSARASSCRADA